MSNRTQGQWSLQNNTEWGWKSNPFSITVRKHGVHRTTIANIPARQKISIDEAKANARLISAAPDLLEALIGCVEHMEHSTQQGKTAYQAARSAISIAIGEQS